MISPVICSPLVTQYPSTAVILQSFPKGLWQNSFNKAKIWRLTQGTCIFPPFFLAWPEVIFWCVITNLICCFSDWYYFFFLILLRFALSSLFFSLSWYRYGFVRETNIIFSPTIIICLAFLILFYFLRRVFLKGDLQNCSFLFVCLSNAIVHARESTHWNILRGIKRIPWIW